MFTRPLEALLHIPRMIIHCILTEKLKMVRVAPTWVLHMLTSNQMQISVENPSKFLGLIVENLTYMSTDLGASQWPTH